MLFCRTKNPDKIVAMASILMLGAALPLMGAIIAQFGFGLAPCHFCLLQRYPYLVVMAMGAFSLLVERGGLRWRFCVAIGICGLLATGILGVIHSGIEGGWIHYTGGCVAAPLADHSIEALRASIANAPLVSCDQPMVEFLGISMAGWNVLWAAFVILLVALQYRFDKKRYDSKHA